MKTAIGVASDDLGVDLFRYESVNFYCSLCVKLYHNHPAHITSEWAICDKCWDRLIREEFHGVLKQGMYIWHHYTMKSNLFEEEWM